jgi:NADH-quinone oxidoreductase subunit L
MGDIKTLALLILLPPFLSFAINGIIIPLRRNGKAAAFLSISAILISTFSALKLLLLVKDNPGPHIYHFTWIPGTFIKPITVGIWIDPLSSIMLLLVGIVASMVQIYSLGYMSEETPPSLGRYYTYHSLFAASMLSLTASQSLLQMYIFWELVGLCSYLLIGFWYYKPSAARAAVKAFWTTRFGDVGFAIGMVILWSHTNTFEIGKLFHMAEIGEIAQPILIISTILIFFGAMGKSAQFPLHIWLPDAMEGPTPVSALIHAATMVAAGVYLVARLFPLYEASSVTLTLVLWIGSFTAFFAATMALVENDIKRVLAYSTISQLGYMMAGLGAGSVVAGFFHLTTHGFFKALLFLAAGSVIHSVGTNDIWQMGKLSKKMPQTAILFLIGTLALAGIFPFSGFFSKDEILLFTYKTGSFIPFFFVMATIFLTAFYMFRVIFVVFWGTREASGHPHESPSVMTLPMWLLAILSIVAGFPKEWFLTFLGEHTKVEAGSLPLISLSLAALGIVVAYLMYQKESISPEKVRNSITPIYNLLRRKYFMDDLYEFLYRNVLLFISTLAGWFDRYVVDGFVNLVSWSTGKAGGILRKTQTGKIQDYLYGILLGLIVLIVWGFWIGF